MPSASTSTGSYLSLDAPTGDFLSTNKYYVPQSGDFTVSVWAKAYSVDSGRFSEILSQGYSGPNGFYLGYHSNGTIRVGDSWYSSVLYPTDGAWHNFQVVKQGSLGSLYIDGVSVETTSNLLNPQGGSYLRIGQQFQNLYDPSGLYNEYYNGAIDEVKIYSSALTKSDLDSVRNNQSITSTPLFSSDFENGLTATESGGSAVNFTSYGSPSVIAFPAPAVLIGDSNSNTLIGTDASESITGNGVPANGVDTIDGKGGIDLVYESGDYNYKISGSPVNGSTIVGSLTTKTPKGTSTINYINDSMTNIEAVKITGGASSNTIDASAYSGQSTLDGGALNDVITGGVGIDFMTGGTGSDIFKFAVKPSVLANTTADHITDFNAAENDKIQVSKSAFGITATKVTLTTTSSNQSLALAQTTSNLFLVDASTGEIHYNANGTAAGDGTNGGVFAILDKINGVVPAIAASNVSLI